MIKMRSRPAFTMVEIMVVLFIIGMLMAFVAPKIAEYVRKAGKTQITLKFATIKEALNDYKLTFGVYPSTREGLRALIENPRPSVDAFKRNQDKWPFLKEADLTDKAGYELIYHCPPEKFKGKYRYYELLYLGPTQTDGDPDSQDDGD